MFPEPGTLAMYLIPALAYALIYSKKLAVFIFLIAIAMTASLGGYVSVLILVFLFLFWKSGKLKNKSLIKVAVVLFAALCLLMISEELMYLYKEKGLSASVRIEQVSYFFNNLLKIVMNNPFGFFLVGETQTALRIDNPDFIGSNFSFYAAFVQGGILSLIGYILFFSLITIVLMKYFWQKHDLDRITACAMLSLPGMLMFVIQRATILESLLFAFLYSAPLLKVLTQDTRMIETKI